MNYNLKKEYDDLSKKIEEITNKLFIKADKDGNNSIQVKDLILEIIEINLY